MGQDPESQTGVAMKKNILFFFLLTFFILMQSHGAEAKKKPEKTSSSDGPEQTLFPGAQKVRLPLITGQDFVGNGLFSTYETWLDIPKHVEVNGDAKLVLYLSHSSTLDSSSTVTAWFNEQPIQSMNLDKDNASKDAHEISIPQHLIKSGANALQFRIFAISNPLQPCQDLENPANWVVLHKDTSIEIPFHVANLEELGLFPLPYVRTGNFAKTPIGIVLPPAPTVEERQAAAHFVRSLAILEPFRYNKLETFLTAPNVNHHLVSFGTLDRNVYQKELKEEAPDNLLGKLNSKSGLVAMIQSPSKPQDVITIISATQPENLLKTTQVLTDAEFQKKMKGKYAIIDTSEPLKLQTPKEMDLANPTLKDLGYRTTKLAGTVENSFSFQYIPPPNWDLLPGTSLILNVGYSPILNPNTSLMTIVMNGKPVQSFKFTGRDGKAQWSTRIPEEMLDSPVFYITLEGSLDISEKDCLSRRYDQTWMVVYDHSYFHLVYEANPRLDLENLSGLFYDKKVKPEVKIIIPDNAGERDFNAAFNIIYALSSLMPKDGLPAFDILNVSETNKELLENSNLILIGAPKQNSLIEKANSGLPVPLDAAGKPTQTQMKILPQFLEEAAAVEISPSHWNSKKNMLVISGERADLVETATHALLNQDIVREMAGKVLLVNGYGQWHSSQMKDGAKRNPQIFTRQFYLWVGVVVFILISLGVTWYWRSRHSLRDPFKEE